LEWCVIITIREVEGGREEGPFPSPTVDMKIYACHWASLSLREGRFAWRGKQAWEDGGKEMERVMAKKKTNCDFS